MFPTGDTLGVVFSFLPTLELLQTCVLVNREWLDVLRKLPHAWGLELNFRRRGFTLPGNFAWSRVQSLRTNQLSPYLINALPQLRRLQMQHNLIHFDISCLRSLSSLTHLVVGCRMTDAQLAHISGLPLEHLNLRGSFDITDAGLELLSNLPLKHLNLDDCTSITDIGLTHLSSLPLQHLDLTNCHRVTDGGLKALETLPLHTLTLSFCHQISNHGLLHLSKLLLQNLDLSYTDITDDGLAHLAQLPLKTLDVSCCQAITDAGLAQLTKLPLQFLGMLACVNVTDAGRSMFQCAKLG
jgi:hypothetical protein